MNEKKHFRPSKEELAEIERRLYISRENFALFTLQGMLNTTRHIVSKVVSPADAKWFEDCILYMMEKIRQDKAKRKR